MASPNQLPLKPSPSKPATAAPPAFEQEVANALLVARRYVWHALALIAVVLVVLAVWHHRRDAARAEIAAAYRVLDEARDLQVRAFGKTEPDVAIGKTKEEKLRQVISQFGTTPAAVEAEILLAKLSFELRQYDEAAKRFADFSQKYPRAEPFSDQARLGEGACLMEQGKFDAALAKYQQLVQPGVLAVDEGVVNRARFNAALCAAMLGDAAKATGWLKELLASSDEEALKKDATALQEQLGTLPPEALKMLSPTYQPPPPKVEPSKGEAPKGDAPKPAAPKGDAPPAAVPTPDAPKPAPAPAPAPEAPKAP